MIIPIKQILLKNFVNIKNLPHSKEEIHKVIFKHFDNKFNYKGYSFKEFVKSKIETSDFYMDIPSTTNLKNIDGIIQLKILDKNSPGSQNIQEIFKKDKKIRYVSALISNKKGTGVKIMKDIEKLQPKMNIALQPSHKNLKLKEYYEKLGYKVREEPNLKDRMIMYKEIKRLSQLRR